MGQEIDLMANYPKSKRDLSGRATKKTDEDQRIARQFGQEFFDGTRDQGYGGFHYFSRFWQPVIPTFQHHYQLTSESSVLDIGCAKGFMLHDFAEMIPGITVKGIDISEYAIDHVIEDMKVHCQVGNAIALPYEDHSVDLIISVTTLHNLELNDLAKSLQEIERVKVKGSFITVDAYRNDEEQERMAAWNLTAKTVMHVDQWKKFFREVGYTGDYYWFIP